MPPSPRSTYDERLGLPVIWWLLTWVFLVSLFVAIAVATPLWVALLGTGVVVVLVVGVLAGWGSARIRLRDDVFAAGRARIPVRLLGEPSELSADATRRLAGVEADARAYLLLRPYLRRAVQVPILDPEDPAPYWLVATRRPTELVAALERARHPLDEPG